MQKKDSLFSLILQSGFFLIQEDSASLSLASSPKVFPIVCSLKPVLLNLRTNHNLLYHGSLFLQCFLCCTGYTIVNFVFKRPSLQLIPCQEPFSPELETPLLPTVPEFS